MRRSFRKSNYDSVNPDSVLVKTDFNTSCAIRVDCTEPRRRNVLLIASSSGKAEEIRVLIQILRGNAINVIFHEEDRQDISRNENDWIDHHFNNADFILVVLTDGLLQRHVFNSVIQKLLSRLENDVVASNTQCAIIRFDNETKILESLSSVYKNLDFHFNFVLGNILQNPLDNRTKYHVTVLLNKILYPNMHDINGTQWCCNDSIKDTSSSVIK